MRTVEEQARRRSARDARAARRRRARSDARWLPPPLGAHPTAPTATRARRGRRAPHRRHCSPGWPRARWHRSSPRCQPRHHRARRRPRMQPHHTCPDERAAACAASPAQGVLDALHLGPREGDQTAHLSVDSEGVGCGPRHESRRAVVAGGDPHARARGEALCLDRCEEEGDGRGDQAHRGGGTRGGRFRSRGLLPPIRSQPKKPDMALAQVSGMV